MCCGGLGILLGARQWGFLVEHDGIGIHVRCVCDRGDRSGLQVSFLVFSCLLHYFGPCLNMSYTENIVALEICLGQ
jgi:hypothetical protein